MESDRREPPVGLVTEVVHGSQHFVQFYEDDACLVDTVSHFIGSGLEGDAAAIVIASSEHAGPLHAALRQRGLDLDALQLEGRLITCDAADSLARFMVDGWPDEARFHELVDRLFARASAGGRRQRVRAFGEMVALLWIEGRREAAIRLERLWNEAVKRHSLALFCAYPMSPSDLEVDSPSVAGVCAEHGHVIPPEGRSAASADEYVRLIVQLQEKGLALDDEVARRKKVEEQLRRREKELADFLETTQEGVLDVDPDGKIRWSNKAVLGLLGQDADGVPRAHIDDVLVTRAAFLDIWSRLARGQAVKDVSIDLRCGDGSVRSVNLHTSVLRMVGQSVHMRWFLRPTVEASAADRM